MGPPILGIPAGVAVLQCRRFSFASLKGRTDLYTAGKESLCVWRRAYVFIDEYASIQGGNMDENQIVAGARSLKCFKC